jgi:hypothetical protein
MKRWISDHPESNAGKGWNKLHPKEAKLHMRKAHLKRVGITPAQYEEMWTLQGGKCANSACSEMRELWLPDQRKGLAVDHDHVTKKVRGLLCRGCNTAIGHVYEDVNRLSGLIEYLRIHSAEKKN